MDKIVSNNTLNIINSSLSFYHTELLKKPNLVKEICKKFSISPEIISNFKIGLCDMSSSALLSKDNKLLSDLVESGYLLHDHKESFYDYLIMPVYTDKNNLCSIAGISFKDRLPLYKYLILTKEQGFLNHQAFGNHDTIIFTHALLSFFEAYQKGIKNIVPMLSNDLSNYQIRLFTENSVKEIFISFIQSKYKDKFQALCRLNLPIYSIKSPEKINKDIQLFTPVPVKIPDKDGSEIKDIPNGYQFNFSGRSYKVQGIKENSSALKIVIRFDYMSESHFDNIDLYSYRNRSSFIKEINQLFGIDDKEIEIDLKKIINHIEKAREDMINSGQLKKYQMTDDEKNIGMKLLKSKDIFQQIHDDMEKLGYIGERINKIITYLAATSRKMESPLACIIISRSSAGKSKLVETAEKMMPEEDVISMSAATDQAFFYMTDGMLSHKLVTIAEQEGKATADYPIRELLSKKSLSKALPIRLKDGTTKTIMIKAEGPVSYIETTTSYDVHPENATRCFTMYIDESQRQTEKVHEYQKHLRTQEGFLQKSSINDILIKHKSAQRLLEPVIIFNPYVKHISFPAHKIRTRRDHERFLNLIEAITFLYQFQRERKKLKTPDGKEIEYIETSIEDYDLAYSLMSDGILETTINELPKGSRDLLIHIKIMLKPNIESTFTRRQIMNFTGWSFTQIRDYIKNLVDLEYLEIVKGKESGKRHEYKLITLNDNDPVSRQITTPAELRQFISTMLEK